MRTRIRHSATSANPDPRGSGRGPTVYPSARRTTGPAARPPHAQKPILLLRSPRGFQQYRPLADILELGSDFLVRLRKSARGESLEPRPLTAADRVAGVLTDTLVRIGWRNSQAAVTRPVRLVEIAQPDKPDRPLRLLTNRLDLSAETIGLIYRHRWQVELFFRRLKCMANFKHFYSESPQGMTLQVYIALIGTLLIAVETGAQPSSYDFALMSMAVAGWAPLEEILAQAAKRRAERRRAAERQRARRAQKTIR